MMHGLNHTEDLGIIFMNYAMMHLVKSESIESAFLASRAVDTALDLSDFYLCHNLNLPN